MIKSINILYHDISDLKAEKAKTKSYAPDNILIQVFMGIMDQKMVRQLLSDIKKVYPGVCVIGTSTSGEIMGADSLENSILVNISLFRYTQVTSVLVHQEKNGESAAQEIANSFMLKAPDLFIVFGSGMKDGSFINNKPFLDALRSEFPDSVIAGGHAGENLKWKTTFAFTENGVTEHGFAAAALSGEQLKIKSAYNLSWVPIGKRMTITKARGNRLYSIDHKSLFDIYFHYLGLDREEILQLKHLSLDFPLMVERNGLLTTNPPSKIHSDGSFEFFQPLYTGEQLRFGFCHPGLLAAGAERLHSELRNFNPQVTYIYSCASRKWLLGNDIAIELSSIGCFPGVAGFFSYGEYYTANGMTHHFQQTMTTLALAENDEISVIKSPPPQAYRSTPEESRQFKALSALHCLIKTSTQEIEAMNHELSELANKDALTGLSNRRQFDDKLSKETKRSIRSDSPISLIMIDIDFFKQFNDTYGHVSGDDCLRGVSQIIKKTIKRPSDTAARYGGEEFACILPITDHEGAIKLAEEIRNGIENLQIPHARSNVADHITASIGVLTTSGKSTDIHPTTFVETCDALLYQAKQAGRNRVISKVEFG